MVLLNALAMKVGRSQIYARMCVLLVAGEAKESDRLRLVLLDAIPNGQRIPELVAPSGLRTAARSLEQPCCIDVIHRHPSA